MTKTGISGHWHQPTGGDMVGNQFTRYYAAYVVSCFNINMFF